MNRTWKPSLQPLEDRCLLSAGMLDPIFGNGGIVTTNVGLLDASESIRALAVQPDGKIVAAGRAAPTTILGGAPHDEFAVVRYNPEGTLDASFSGDGKAFAAFSQSSGDSAQDVELQTDGKILVAGWTMSGSDNDFALVRFRPDGNLDTAFGGKAKGNVVTSIGKNSMDAAHAMEIQPDGKIVLAGLTRAHSSSDVDVALIRYKPDGALDRSFSGDGKVTTHFSEPVGSVEMAIYPSNSQAQAGKIVVVTVFQTSGAILVARFSPNGSIDPSFGGGTGYVTLANTYTYGDQTPAVAIQSDDRVVITFARSASDSSDICLARLDPDGSLDGTISAGGVAHISLPDIDKPRSIALQADGKIIVAGWQLMYLGEERSFNFFAARLNPLDGSLDSTYGTNGMATSTGIAVYAQTVDVAILPDGKVVVGGGTDGTIGTTPWDFVLARFTGDDALTANATAPHETRQTLSTMEVEPLLTEALARWQTAGVDTSGFGTIDFRIANLGGATLGLASGNTIWLDDNAAGWGWFVDTAPGDDSEFTTPGNQGEQGKMDLLTALAHEIGHLLGHDHEEADVMADALAPGVRRMPGGEIDWLTAVDVLFAETSTHKRKW